MLLFGYRLELEQVTNRVVLDAQLHVREHVERLFLVLDEGVPLTVGPQPDTLFQVVHGQQVVLPGRIDDLQQDVPLELAHLVRSDALFLRLVAPLDFVDDVRGDIAQRSLTDLEAVLLRIEPEELLHLLDERFDFPVVGIVVDAQVVLDQALHQIPRLVQYVSLLFLAAEHLPAQSVDLLALHVVDVVVLEQVLARIEVPLFDLFLGPLDSPGDHRGFDGNVLFHAQRLHRGLHLFAGEDAHQVVIERQVKARGPRIALAAGAPAQLVVHAARLVAFRPDDQQPAQPHDLVVLPGTLGPRSFQLFGVGPLPFLGRSLPRLDASIGQGLAGQELGVSAEQDVGAASGHVGGYGHRPDAPGLGHDLSLALVVLGVEHDVLDAALAQQVGQVLRLLDADRTHQHWLAGLLGHAQVAGHRIPLFGLGAVDHVRVLEAQQGFVGRDHRHLELVDLVELHRLGVRGAGHSRQLVVHAEVVLERDRRQRLVLTLDTHAFLGLDGLVQAVAPATPRHQASRELVHDHDLSVLDHVVHVALEQRVRLERLIDVVQQLEALGIVEIVHTE